MPTMLTIKAAAEQTGLTYSCLRRWILEGKFPFYVRAGNKYFVNQERLVDFLNTPATAPAVSGIRRVDA